MGRPGTEPVFGSVAQVPEPVLPTYRNRVRKVSPRYRSQSVVQLAEQHTDLRCSSRAGDGKRTSVLSLGSPSRSDPPPAAKRKSPAERISHLNAVIRYCPLLVVACCTKWVQIGLLHAVARRRFESSATTAESAAIAGCHITNVTEIEGSSALERRRVTSWTGSKVPRALRRRVHGCQLRSAHMHPCLS